MFAKPTTLFCTPAGRPNLIMSFKIFLSNLILFNSTLNISLPLNNLDKDNITLIAYDIVVANATDQTPSLNTPTNNKSKITLVIDETIK